MRTDSFCENDRDNGSGDCSDEIREPYESKVGTHHSEKDNNHSDLNKKVHGIYEVLEVEAVIGIKLNSEGPAQ